MARDTVSSVSRSNHFRYIHYTDRQTDGRTDKYNITALPEIFAWRKFSPFLPPALIGKIFIPRIVFPVLMIRVYGDLYHMGETLFHFCNAKVAGLGNIFVQLKFSAVRYIYIMLLCLTCGNG